MGKIELSIIIVDYNTKNHLFNCLKSIKANEPKSSFEIIIVDNNHRADLNITENEICPILPNIKYTILNTPENRGFGASNNVGAKKASGKYLLLLNPDTLIVDNSIDKMHDFISKHGEIGALTCLLYQKDRETLQSNFFGKFQSFSSVLTRRYDYQKIDMKKEFFYTDIVTGAALMIKRKLFDELEGFDENIFLYLEDDDLCKRLVDIGYKNGVLIRAKIIHLEGKSLSKDTQRKNLYYKSQTYFWNKHNGFLPALLMRIIRWPYKLYKTRGI